LSDMDIVFPLMLDTYSGHAVKYVSLFIFSVAVVQGYNAYREWCGLARVKSFDELYVDLPTDVVNRFKILYA